MMFAECGSPAFMEFLELMGQRVRMKGFNKYRAQLDNKSECKSLAVPVQYSPSLAYLEAMRHTNFLLLCVPICHSGSPVHLETL